MCFEFFLSAFSFRLIANLFSNHIDASVFSHSFAGTGTQRQQANNFNSNNDSYSYSNVRTENTTSNNNQLEAWSDGDNQQMNAGQTSIVSGGNGAAASAIVTNAHSLSTDQNTINSSSYHFAPSHTATQQLNTNLATTSADNNHNSNNNNNLPILLNNNNDPNDMDHFGTSNRLRTKLKKFKKFFTKN